MQIGHGRPLHRQPDPTPLDPPRASHRDSSCLTPSAYRVLDDHVHAAYLSRFAALRGPGASDPPVSAALICNTSIVSSVSIFCMTAISIKPVNQISKLAGVPQAAMRWRLFAATMRVFSRSISEIENRFWTVRNALAARKCCTATGRQHGVAQL